MLLQERPPLLLARIAQAGEYGVEVLDQHQQRAVLQPIQKLPLDEPQRRGPTMAAPIRQNAQGEFVGILGGQPPVDSQQQIEE